MSVDVMNGGTIAVGAKSVTFTNATSGTVYVNNCQLPGFPSKVGIPHGGGNVVFSPPGPAAVAGSYSYSTSASIGGTLPIIKVQ